MLNEAVGALMWYTMSLTKEDLEKFKDAISRPYGLIFLTGPTGSGKTTTLYAALKKSTTAMARYAA